MTSIRVRYGVRARVVLASVALVMSAAVGFAAQPAGAVTVSHTYYVGTTADNETSHSQSLCEQKTNTVCTLRWDVEQATDDGSGYVDTIKFSTHVGSTITLNSTNGYIELDGEEALTIDGQGPSGTLISGGHKSEVFETDMYTLSIENLTIENGYTADNNGGAVSNDYDLVLNNVNFTGNQNVLGSYSGGAVYSDYHLTVNGGTYSHNVSESCGGAIDVEYEGTITRAQFVDNSSDCGGAINVPVTTDSVDISDSFFLGNSSRDYDDGGAIEINGDGSVLNSTFVDNVSTEYGGAIAYDNGGYGSIANNTIVNNWALQGGGGIASDRGDVEVSGNIITGNTEDFGGPGTGVLAQCVDYGTDFEDQGGNVIGPDTDADCGFNQPTDRLNANAHLGALAKNGGPTPTMAITATSLAATLVPAGLCPLSDQRGQPRGGKCSAGAYQVEPTGSVTTCKTLTGSILSTVTFKNCVNKGSANTSVGGSGALLVGGGKMTWHPSAQKTTISVTVTELGSNACGGGFETLKVFGIVSSSGSPAAKFFDRVSATVCEAAGTEDVSLLHGTNAKF